MLKQIEQLLNIDFNNLRDEDFNSFLTVILINNFGFTENLIQIKGFQNGVREIFCSLQKMYPNDEAWREKVIGFGYDDFGCPEISFHDKNMYTTINRVDQCLVIRHYHNEEHCKDLRILLLKPHQDDVLVLKLKLKKIIVEHGELKQKRIISFTEFEKVLVEENGTVSERSSEFGRQLEPIYKNNTECGRKFQKVTIIKMIQKLNSEIPKCNLLKNLFNVSHSKAINYIHLLKKTD